MQSLFVINCMAVMMCLASLLGFWAVLSRQSVRVRCLGFLVGNLVLGLALCTGLGEFEMEWIVLVSLATSFVASLAGALRFSGIGVVHLSQMVDEPANDLQFSLRQMMTAVTVVAMLLAIGRVSVGAPQDIAFGFALALGFALVAVTVLWGVLGRHDMRARLASVCLVALSMASVFYYVMEATAIDPGSIWFSVVIAYSMLLAVSLSGVRARGYRLARIIH